MSVKEIREAVENSKYKTRKTSNKAPTNVEARTT